MNKITNWLIAAALPTFFYGQLGMLTAAHAAQPATFVISTDPSGGDCASVGSWDSGTRTCTLTVEGGATYAITNSDTGGDCVFLGTWNDKTSSCTLTPDWSQTLIIDESAGSITENAVRFATFNASLNRFSAGDLVADLSAPGNPQAEAVAEIIQRTAPDVLLINEFDFDAAGQAALFFQDNYLSLSQNGADPIIYPYRFVAPSNTGIPSGFDLNNNGFVGDPDDAFGFGFFPGQYGMVVYSRYRIITEEVRTFQLFLWKDMPGALLPDDPETPEPDDWYSAAELDVFRLSSKSHWDIPIQIGERAVHLLASHPTPPVFDGPEDRNGRRNHDEIRFWADYIIPSRSGYIVDDNGVVGGLTPGDPFVIAGDLNADPFDGDGLPGAVAQVLDHPLVNTKLTPSSEGGPEQAALQGGANDTHTGDPAFDTADFSDFAPGNLRVDYVLPRKGLQMIDAGVFWPTTADPLFPLVGTFPFPSSDHRLVWIDVKVPSR